MRNIGLAELLVVFVALSGLLVYVIPFFFIFKKAGYSAWLGLLLFIPLVNLILLYVLAFAEWPVLRRTQ